MTPSVLQQGRVAFSRAAIAFIESCWEVLTLINIEGSNLQTDALTETFLGQPHSFFGRRKGTQSLPNLQIATSGNQRQQRLNDLA